MKTCPVCAARAFDDAPICYGCLHRFDGAGRAYGDICEDDPFGPDPFEEPPGVGGSPKAPDASGLSDALTATKRPDALGALSSEGVSVPVPAHGIEALVGGYELIIRFVPFAGEGAEAPVDEPASRHAPRGRHAPGASSRSGRGDAATVEA